MAVTTGVTAAGTPVLILIGQNEQVQIPVKFSPSVSPHLFDKIVSAPRFTSWANSYLPRPQQRLKLQELIFQSVELENDAVNFIKLFVDVIRSPEKTQVGGTVMLNGPSAAVLVVFRVNPEDAGPGSENTPVYRPDDSNTQSTGTRPREYVLFIKQARPAVGAPEHREMPWGHIDSSGIFSGAAAVAIHSSCGLRFHESQMEDMTSLALSAHRAPARSLGVSLSPTSLDERVRLYLYRETVTREFIEAFQKRRNDTDPIALDLWTLNDAWRITSDAKTLSALFLFHELRYHQLMPRYRPPREFKRTPKFTAVAELNPNEHGVNLKVKVAESLQIIPREDRPNAERGVVVVGDSTGVVTLSLEPSQTSLASGFGVEGSPLFLRNVEFDMSDGHIKVILDTFGKVSSPTNEEISQFNFTVNKNNNVSATEYEKVFPHDSYHNGAATYSSRRGGRGGTWRGGRAVGRASRGRF